MQGIGSKIFMFTVIVILEYAFKLLLLIMYAVIL